MLKFPVGDASDLPVGATVREGWRYVVPAAVATAALWRVSPVLGLAGLGATGLLAAFFRDPVREIDAAVDELLAPADGHVLALDEIDDAWHIGGPAVRVSIFLSVFDVHVNRAPCAGRIVEIRDHHGGFRPAMDFAGSHSNRRREIALETDRGPLVVVQVAGLLARRIVGWCDEGDALGAGQKFGMITFGSRTDLIAPRGQVEALVRPRQRTVGGRTVIARWLSTS